MMQDTRFRMHDTRYKMHDSRCKIHDSGYKINNSMPYAPCSMLIDERSEDRSQKSGVRISKNIQDTATTKDTKKDYEKIIHDAGCKIQDAK
jgi:hypothetical protein